MALPTDIPWSNCNSVAEMTFVCTGSIVDLYVYSCLLRLDLCSVLVQILAGIQTEVSHVFQLITHHPTFRCCSLSHWQHHSTVLNGSIVN
jgi:hypothetical protein